MKKCTKCGSVKPPKAFYKNKSRCKACMDAEHAAYKALNAERIAAYKAQWRSENIVRIKTARKAQYHADPNGAKESVKRWTAANADLANKTKRKWKRLNPSYARADAGKRRAARLMATPAWADQRAIQSIYAEAVSLGLHVDHIVPLRSKVVCGLHCEANLQLLTQQENLMKNNKHWPDMP